MDIERLRELCAAGRMVWTNHALLRILKRGILRDDVRAAIIGGEIIEDYPSDYPNPSCLVLGGMRDGSPLHIVCGISENALWIITAYRPSPGEWEADNKTRKEQTK